MDKVKVTIKFTATATIEVDPSDLNPEEYNASDPESIKEAAREWAMDNAIPMQYFSDYSGKNQIICVRDVPADLEVWKEMSYFVEGRKSYDGCIYKTRDR